MAETGTKSDLAHVYWIGGSPCAGKSSVSRLLGETYHIRVYHCDDMLPKHKRRMVPGRHPVLHKWTSWSWDRLWMQSAGELLSEAIAAYTEHFGMVVEDLRSLPRSMPIIAEATALLPSLVANELWERHQAVWLVPTEGFQRERYRGRGSWVDDILGDCSEPERAYANWMDRDVVFARWVAATVADLAYRSIEVDGSRSLAETACLVANHLRLDEVATRRETPRHSGTDGLRRAPEDRPQAREQ